MQFGFYLPTKILFGQGCVIANAQEFSSCGNRAFIVSGRNSARVSGALSDVEQVLNSEQISWQLFAEIEENPTIESVIAAAEQARQFAPDMIIAIGGGSPLDAAKAIAVLAVNTITQEQLFSANFLVKPLPVLAIPLTAGTGSEVTPYSILTDNQRQTKRNLVSPTIFPRVAFLDAAYTQSLPQQVTINAAIDALSHVLEGYLARRATPASDALAVDALRCFGSIKDQIKDNITLPVRQSLLYISLLGGMVIAHTGTTLVHALGYSLTYFKQIPHGRANGLLLAEYLRYSQSAVPQKTDTILSALGLASIEDFSDYLTTLLPLTETFSREELVHFAELASQTANIGNSPRQPQAAELEQLLTAALTGHVID